MTDDDAPGYLMDALRHALSNGMTHLTLFRVGTSTIGWQASCRGRGDKAYRIAIETDPVVALCSVMGAASVSSAPAAGVADEPEDIFA